MTEASDNLSEKNIHVLISSPSQGLTVFPVVYRTSMSSKHPNAPVSLGQTQYTPKVHVVSSQVHVHFSDLENFEKTSQLSITNTVCSQQFIPDHPVLPVNKKSYVSEKGLKLSGNPAVYI